MVPYLWKLKVISRYCHELCDSFNSGTRVPYIILVVQGYCLASNSSFAILYNAAADSKTLYHNLIIISKINIWWL